MSPYSLVYNRRLPIVFFGKKTSKRGKIFKKEREKNEHPDVLEDRVIRAKNVFFFPLVICQLSKALGSLGKNYQHYVFFSEINISLKEKRKKKTF